jgi:hypothetical protein
MKDYLSKDRDFNQFLANSGEHRIASLQVPLQDDSLTTLVARHLDPSRYDHSQLTRPRAIRTTDSASVKRRILFGQEFEKEEAGAERGPSNLLREQQTEG